MLAQPARVAAATSPTRGRSPPDRCGCRVPGWPIGEGVDLSPGVPDLSAFPRSLWLRTERAVLTETPPEELGYGDPRGHPRLRAALAPWLARTRGLRAGPDDIVIVSGVAQAMALLAQQLRREGIDSIAVEDPGSRGAVDEFAYWGLRPVPVPVDDDGIRVDRAGRHGCRRVRFLTPAHQFPTGVVLAPHRGASCSPGQSTRELVIEDDYDAEYRYDRAPVPALHAAAPDRIAYAGSTSKSLAPALRLGWLVARRAGVTTTWSRPSTPATSAARPCRSSCWPGCWKAASTTAMSGWCAGRHRARRDALLDALATELPAASVKGVAAGLHLLVTLPEGSADDTALADELRDAGVLVHPLSWHRRLPGPPGLVLGYAAHNPDRLREAAVTIGRVVS